MKLKGIETHNNIFCDRMPSHSTCHIYTFVFDKDVSILEPINKIRKDTLVIKESIIKGIHEHIPIIGNNTRHILSFGASSHRKKLGSKYYVSGHLIDISHNIHFGFCDEWYYVSLFFMIVLKQCIYTLKEDTSEDKEYNNTIFKTYNAIYNQVSRQINSVYLPNIDDKKHNVFTPKMLDWFNPHKIKGYTSELLREQFQTFQEYMFVNTISRKGYIPVLEEEIESELPNTVQERQQLTKFAEEYMKSKLHRLAEESLIKHAHTLDSIFVVGNDRITGVIDSMIETCTLYSNNPFKLEVHVYHLKSIEDLKKLNEIESRKLITERPDILI